METDGGKGGGIYCDVTLSIEFRRPWHSNRIRMHNKGNGRLGNWKEILSFMTKSFQVK